MTIKEVKEILAVDGVTVWYDHAPVGTEVPFITFTCNKDNNVFADDKVYVKKGSLSVRLYSPIKDEALEKKLEDALDAAELPWKMTDDFDTEDVFITIYESEVI